MIAFLSPLCKKHLCKEKVAVVSKIFPGKFFKSCRTIFSTEASIPTLTKTAKHSDVFSQGSSAARWRLCSSAFISEDRERGSTSRPGQHVSFWLWRPRTNPSPMFGALRRTELPFHAQRVTGLGVLLMALVMF